jgi:hypothetical protein
MRGTLIPRFSKNQKYFSKNQKYFSKNQKYFSKSQKYFSKSQEYFWPMPKGLVRAERPPHPTFFKKA